MGYNELRNAYYINNFVTNTGVKFFDDIIDGEHKGLEGLENNINKWIGERNHEYIKTGIDKVCIKSIQYFLQNHDETERHYEYSSHCACVVYEITKNTVRLYAKTHKEVCDLAKRDADEEYENGIKVEDVIDTVFMLNCRDSRIIETSNEDD